MFVEILGVEGTRSGANPDEILHDTGRSHSDHRWCHPGKAGHLAFQYIDRQTDRNARVDRIASRFLEPRLGRQGMACDDHDTGSP